MEKIVTPEEQAKYRDLNRIRMKAYRDKSRKRKYSPHPTIRKENIDCVQKDEASKQ